MAEAPIPALFITPSLEKNQEKQIIESKSYNLKLEEIEYELIMSITQDNYIQYKLIQKNTIASSYFFVEYDLSIINKLLYVFFKEIKDIFNFYDKILNKNKVKLVLSKERNKMCLNFKNIINFDEEVDTNLELKEIKLKSEDMIYILFKEVQCLKTEMKKKKL